VTVPVLPEGDDLLAVQAHAQRYMAARASLVAGEIELIRSVAAALGSGASTEQICAALETMDVDVGEFPHALRATLGYPVDGV
jgi:hypothetical protein